MAPATEQHDVTVKNEFSHYLKLNFVELPEGEAIDIINDDGRTYGSIIGGPEITYEGRPRFDIHAWSTDFNVAVFLAGPMDNGLIPVAVNGEQKFIRERPGVTLLQAPREHLQGSVLTTYEANPIRTEPDANGEEIVIDYDISFFHVLEQKGDWSLVQCVADCEGCPPGKEGTSGWLKTLENGKIIVALSYVC